METFFYRTLLPIHRYERPSFLRRRWGRCSYRSVGGARGAAPTGLLEALGAPSHTGLLEALGAHQDLFPQQIGRSSPFHSLHRSIRAPPFPRRHWGRIWTSSSNRSVGAVLTTPNRYERPPFLRRRWGRCSYRSVGGAGGASGPLSPTDR